MKSRDYLLLVLSVAGVTIIATSCRPVPEGPYNLLLITVDSLRPDRLGYGGHDRDTSATIDQLAAEGVRFERCYSQSGWTLPSIATILTGLYPREHGATDVNRRIHRGVTTLAEILAERGYDTQAFISHVLLTAKSGLAKGFRVYNDSVLDVGHPHAVATAQPITDRVIVSLGSIEQPFFLWIHYFDPHFQYIRHAGGADFGRRQIDRYDGEIAHTDGQIGRLLAELRAREIYDRTVVVLTADHGEEFGEHGGKFHYGLHEVDVRVPLVIKAPTLKPRTERRVAQQIDLLPTLLDLLRIESPPDLPGQALFQPHAADRPVFIERFRPPRFVQRAIISGDRKLYIVDVNEKIPTKLKSRIGATMVRPGISLFDLGQDPDEMQNLYPGEITAAAPLLELLARYVETPSLEGERLAVDEELEEKLRSLGYLQ